MTAPQKPARFRPAAPVLALVAALPLVLGAPAAQAQAPQPAPQSRWLAEEDAIDPHAAFLRFAAEYAESTVAGLLIGGLLAHQLAGGPTAILAGSVGGALAASWLFVDHASGIYVVRQVSPKGTR